jgi:hypothetical protein
VASPRFALCRLSGAGCLETRCPLADQFGGAWVGCREGWLRWDPAEPPALNDFSKARLNLYLRLHDLPIPEELRFSPLPSRR